ncbi:helix-turn-helix domain-containing protein [Candidatus Woesearchaeota archaeon]|nr:helix-turn-helix domain-containing protein [Candidatus Woesearchaeota archaeon]
MWVVKLKIKHDCTIGNRCKKFNCLAFSLPLSGWQEKGKYYTSQRHTLEGEEKQVQAFIRDLKKDPRILKIESSKNTIFIVERRSGKVIPASHYHPRLFFVRPIFVDRQGFEYWEVASWEKPTLMNFVGGIKKEKEIKVQIERFQKVKLDTIYFPKIMPRLSARQHLAFQLALEEGYYAYPRKIELQQLAKLMKISTSTFQEHLRRAEQKNMPSYA